MQDSPPPAVDAAPEDPPAGRLDRAARLVLASQLAFGLPVLLVSGDRPDYWLAYQCDGIDLALVALAAGFGPGLLACLLETRLPAFHRLHLALWLLPPSLLFSGWGLGLTGASRWVSGLALTAFGERVLGRWPAGLAGALVLLGLSALAPLYFVTASPLVPLLARPLSPPPGGPVRAPTGPVVVVVFDGLPLHTLLDAEGALDRGSFPNFARLADRASFFRNASCHHPMSAMSIPTLLTGRLPTPGRLPLAAHHPDTLFRLLAGRPVRLAEPYTGLGPGEGPGVVRFARSRAERLRLIGRDLRQVAPLLLAAVPSDQELGELVQGLQLMHARSDGWGLVEEGSDRSSWFRRLVASLGPEDRDSLVYAHMLLPHPAWNHLPDGRMYPSRPEAGAVRLKVLGTNQLVFYWSRDPWDIVQSAQRELLQVGYVDRLLGELLDRLEALGLLDPALLVVTSDHGWAVAPGSFPRDVVFPDSPLVATGMAPNWLELVPVPLFVKLPGQTQGRIDDRNAELVDVLPTVAGALGLPVPWPVDGRDLFGPGPEPGGKRFFELDFTPRSLPGTLEGRLEVARTRRSWFAPGAGRAWILRPLPHGGWVGREVPPATGTAAVRVRLDPAGAGPEGVLCGTAEGSALAGGPAWLAFVADGKVVAVTRTQGGANGSASFLAFVDDSVMAGSRTVRERLSVRLFDPGSGAPRIPVALLGDGP